MTRNELKDIIKECLLDMKYDNSNNITLESALEDVVAEASSITSYYDNNIIESYIEESNNFNNIIVAAVTEAVDKETINRLKEKAKKAIKAIIEKIQKFITFIKGKLSMLIKKIKEKVSKLIKDKFPSINRLKEEHKLKNEMVNKVPLIDKIYDVVKCQSKRISSVINDLRDDKPTMNIFSDGYCIPEDFSLREYNDNNYTKDMSILDFVSYCEKNLDKLEYIQDSIQNNFDPLSNELEKIKNKLKEELNNIGDQKITDIRSKDQINNAIRISYKKFNLSAVNEIFDDCTTFIMKTESYCLEFVRIYEYVRIKLNSYKESIG